MTEQSIRDELAVFLSTEVDSGEPMWSAVVIADKLLASPVVRRIQAEAWGDGEYSGRVTAIATGSIIRSAVNPFGYVPGLQGGTE